MDTFAALAAAGNWDLSLPVVAHGVTIDEPALSAARGPQPATPSLTAAGDAKSKGPG